MREIIIDDLPETLDGLDVIQEEEIAKECLMNGQTIARFEFGDSMSPFLVSGQFAKLVPLSKNDTIKECDCVTSVINGVLNTHMVWKIKEQEDGSRLYCIASSSGHVMGWTDTILAKAIPMNYTVVKGGHRTIKTSRFRVDSLTPSPTPMDLDGVERTTIQMDGDVPQPAPYINQNIPSMETDTYTLMYSPLEEADCAVVTTAESAESNPYL